MDVEVQGLDVHYEVKGFPRATYAVLDRAGHLVNLEQRVLFEALADEWLRRVEECHGDA